MAVRVLTYVGLLYQDWIKAHEIPRGEPLPNVLPIVLYNGTKRWRAVEDIASLLYECSDGLEKYRPSQRYLLIDEGAYDERSLTQNDNLVAILFRLENCFERHRAVDLVMTLIDRLEAAETDSLRRAFAIWIRRVVFGRFRNGSVDDAINPLWETKTMLADRAPVWWEEWKEEGRQVGREEGREEGRQEGRQEGEMSMLSRLLRARFGELPDSVRERLQSATCEQLESWGEKLLHAASLGDLFDVERTASTAR